ncbi:MULTISPECIES: hypothetical protein [Nitrospirillum]|uniref:Phasin protein n=1 Tax=Nitrospirillum amazonense TaxID=28077 RepID=A0A560G740_9PROT|nr:hypothetical protein [Nitrospirillum amazonense]MEC4592129.1 hypothetical protein [Nitrospirillum amazonense]TWB29712.1 hypothetical protein FBZ88_103135 [Nitrospirillum amazonense]
MPDATQPLNPAGTLAKGVMEEVLTGNVAWLDDVHNVYGRWTQGMLGTVQELVRLWEGRFHEDCEACKALSACHTPLDLQRFGQAFAVKASRDYAEGVGRLLHVAVEALGPRAGRGPHG